MNAASYRFTHAVTRRPSRNVVDGLRACDIGVPDLETFQADHDDYVAALESTGASVTVLEPLDAFPDSVFVEDTALCLPHGAILMRPGAPSRFGEVATIAPVLRSFYDQVVKLESGFVEGGDILVTEREILVGTSDRTDDAGVEALTAAVRGWGYSVRRVATPPDVLHFKTDCSLLDEETVLSTQRLSASGCFEGYRVLHVVGGEEACANAIRFNDLVIMPAGFPRTREMLAAEGYEVRTVGNTEAAKIDGGMSCLSLRFTPSLQ